jgi:hypothetical protein
MFPLQFTRLKFLAAGLGSFAILVFVALPLVVAGQDKKDAGPVKVDPALDHSKHAPTADAAVDKSKSDGATSDSNKEVLEQIKLLQAKVSKLEGSVAKIAPPPGGMKMGGKKGMPVMGGAGGAMPMADDMDMPMGGGPSKPGMGMMDMMMGGMGGKKGMSGGSESGMGMMEMDMPMAGMSSGSGGMSMMDDMDMMGMGNMGSPKGKKMKMAAALPGFPGASHIYHIGATDFFLDHPEHLTLSTEQQAKLNRAKQKALTDKSSAQRKIEEAEQELWELTASDQPDAAAIEPKVRQIEKLRGDQRLAFIRAVGEAAKALTDEQRQILLGTSKPDKHQKADPAAHKAHTP